MTVFIGADPELFVRGISSGQFISSHNLVPGTKEHPHKVDKGAIQVDGTALEFNIDPADNYESFQDNLSTVMSQLIGYVHQANPKVEVIISPTARYSPEYFKSIPKESLVSGCDPDFDAYTGNVNVAPETDEPIRVAGGHIHVGYTNQMDLQDAGHFEDCRIVTRQLDAILFLPSLLWDRDMTRRRLYGKPGTFRPKSYGVEYRSLSNKWLTSPKITRWIFDSIQEGMAMLEHGDSVADEIKCEGRIRSAYHGTDTEILGHVHELEKLGFPEFPIDQVLLT